ncbi:hypothetical protein EV127DRAFT_422983 [Xylaria flabelliformis]|nr:hypothetical protein EV127DRAFT_422983 [Xylaria flabelliformis]
MTMENIPPVQNASSRQPPEATTTSGHKRSGSGGSILSRFPFLRTSESRSSLDDARTQQHSAAVGGDAHSQVVSERPARALAAALSQQKTRRRRGSLRKVALLGRGAAREKRDLKPQSSQQQQQLPQPLAIDTSQIFLQQPSIPPPIQQHQQQQQEQQYSSSDTTSDVSAIGLGLSDASFAIPSKQAPTLHYPTQMPSPTISYTSTTDEEDGLSMSLPVPSLSQSDQAPFASGSESYYRGSSHRAQSPANSIQRRRSMSKQQYAKSPLSLQGLATGSPALANIDSGHHDYSETEWWGWVVLIVTWSVFVIGMGSCLNVWSWAWDVGSTPYAPPELEDDPTLPIVGYYPALIILTCIMAWVWVIVAWVGMKYFRHAKISGD